MSEESISTIFVRPRNKYYCEYFINDSKSAHTKKYDDIKEYLYEIIPERFVQINYSLSRFQPFIADIINKKIIFLQLNDIKEHYNELDNIIRNPTLEMAQKELRDSNKTSMDDKIRQISELRLNK